jgi:hypothetical protein
VSFAAITLYVPSQRVFSVVSVYFVIHSIQKLLDTLSYTTLHKPILLYISISCKKGMLQSTVADPMRIIFVSCTHVSNIRSKFSVI